MYIRRSRRDSYNVAVDEAFKRDNVVDYHIDGGGEEDVDRRFGDFMHSFDGDREHFSTDGGRTRVIDHYNDSNRSDRGYTGSNEASPTFILLRPVRNTRKSSPLPSAGRSSEDEFYECGNFHYGRAVAVDLSNNSPRGKRPTDKGLKEEEQQRSSPDRFHITTNPLINGKTLDQGSNVYKKTPNMKPHGNSSSRSDDKIEISSSDEGFASAMAPSPPSSQDDGPTHKISTIPHVKVEVPLTREHRNKSPKKNPKNKTTKAPAREPVKSNAIIRDDVPFPPNKNFDAGSDPDVVSSPPEKVTSPRELENFPFPHCPSPSVQLKDPHVPPNDTLEAKLNGLPDKKFQNGIPDIPDAFPPPYDYGKCNLHDDFPPPPKEAFAFARDPENNKRPKNPISMPHPANFLPRDSLERYSVEGGGSPSGSLSSLGSDGGDDVTWKSVNQFGDRFRKLAGIYGMPPAVSFSPHDEIIE